MTWVTYLYGDLEVAKLPRVTWLSMTLFCIIGSFWLLDSLKDTVFAALVGLEYQPRAKFVSVVVTLVLVFGYNRLLDRVNKATLFYAIGTGYTLIFGGVALLLGHDSFGVANGEASPWRLLGWVSYFAIESYGSLAVALFWAFTNASLTLAEAKSSYGLIIAFAQLGAVLGSTLATRAEAIGLPQLYGIGALSCSSMVWMVRGYNARFPPAPEAADSKPSSSKAKGDCASLTDGLHLVIRYDYVLLILGISCLYEVVLTVLDYEMKVIGRARYGADVRAAEQFATLMGHFGQVTNGLSFVFSLFGTSMVVRQLGLRRSLRVFPCLLVGAVLLSFLFPNLWVLFVSMSCLKALTYALNEPCKEMLYMPTSETIKFKAKAWIDVFGARTAKALGSTITNTAGNQPELLVRYGSMPSLLISLALFGISVLVGKHFEDLIASGEIVGEESAGPKEAELARSDGSLQPLLEDVFIEHEGQRLTRLDTFPPASPPRVSSPTGE